VGPPIDFYYWGCAAKSTSKEAVEMIILKLPEMPKNTCAGEAFLRRCGNYVVLMAGIERAL